MQHARQLQIAAQVHVRQGVLVKVHTGRLSSGSWLDQLCTQLPTSVLHTSVHAAAECADSSCVAICLTYA